MNLLRYFLLIPLLVPLLVKWSNAQTCSTIKLESSVDKVCIDNSIELRASGVPAGSDYTWHFGNQVKYDDKDEVKFIALKEGKTAPYLLVKTPTNLTCKVVLAGNGTIDVNGKPKKLNVSVSPNTKVCQLNKEITLTANGGDPDFKYTYLVETHGNTSQDYLYSQASTNPVIKTKLSHVGYKKVTLVLENAFGCVTNLEFDSLISVGNVPTPGFGIVDPKTCEKKVIDIIDSTDSENNLSYFWSTPGASTTTSTDKEPKQLIYSTIGRYDISLTVSDDYGCSKTEVKKNIVIISDEKSIDVDIEKTDICEGEQITLTAVGNNIDPKYFQWNLPYAVIDQGKSNKSKQVVHYWQAPLKQDIGLIYDDGGCKTEVLYEDTIIVYGVRTSIKADMLCACKPDTVNFDGSASSSIANDSFNYKWTITDENGKGIANGSLEDFSHIFKNTGEFNVSFQAISKSNGCSSTSGQLITFEKPVAQIATGKKQLCLGEKAEAYLDPGKMCEEAIETVQWRLYNANGKLVTSQSKSSFSYQLLEPGKYSLELNISTHDGCSDQQKFTDLFEAYQVETKITTADEFLCVGDSVLVEATNGPYPTATSIQWRIIDPKTKKRFTGDGTSLHFPIAAPGLFDIQLFSVKSQYCADTVILKNQFKVGGVDADIVTGVKEACVPFSDMVHVDVKKNYLFHGGNNSIAYLWSSPHLSGIGISDKQNDTTKVGISKSGYYNLTLTITNSEGCVTTITRDKAYTAGVIANFKLNEVACTDVALEVENQSQINATTFKWSVSDNSVGIKPKNKAKNPRLFFAQPGEYTVSLQAKNSLGCVDSISKKVKAVQFNFDFVSEDNQNVLCAPALVKFEVTNTNVDSFHWFFGDDDSLSISGNQVAHLYDILKFDPASIYKFDVSLVGISRYGCYDTLTREDYIVMSGPRPSFVFDPGVGSDAEMINFYEQNEAVSSYSFDYGDKSTAIDDSIPNHIYHVNDTNSAFVEYTPFMVARDNRGCTRRFDAGPVLIYNDAIPRFMADTLEACHNTSVTLRNFSSFADSFQWFMNGDTMPFSYDEHPTLVMPIGKNSITLKAFNSIGHASTLTKWDYINIYADPTVSIALEHDFYCENRPVEFQDKSYGQNAIIARKWEFNPGLSESDTSSSVQPSFIYNTAGSKSVRLTVWDEIGCTATRLFADTVMVDIPKPIAHRGLSYLSYRGPGVLSVHFPADSLGSVKGYLLNEVYADDSSLIIPIGQSMNTLLDTGYYEFRSKNFESHYRLLGVSECRDTIPVGPLHNIARLNVEELEGQGLPQLSWTPYEGWKTIDSYMVYRSEDGSAFKLIATVAGSDHSYIDNRICRSNYQYYIKPFSFQELNRSRSNPEEIAPDYIPPVGVTELFTTTVVDNNRTLTTWLPHENLQITEYLVSRTDPNFGFIERHALVKDTFYVDTIEVFADRNVYHYEIRAIDNCANETPASIKGNSILISISRTENDMNIEWNLFEDWPADSTIYFLEKSGEDGVFETIITGKNLTTYVDEEVFENEDEKFKYRIRAEYKDRTTYSNIVSELPEIRIYIPNAFSPNNDGINDEYQVFGSAAQNGSEPGFDNFSMSIFNRWGQKVYSSNNIHESWDGKFNGTESPVGTYIYIIEFRDRNGRFHRRNGNLTLIN